MPGCCVDPLPRCSHCTQLLRLLNLKRGNFRVPGGILYHDPRRHYPWGHCVLSTFYFFSDKNAVVTKSMVRKEKRGKEVSFCMVHPLSPFPGLAFPNNWEFHSLELYQFKTQGEKLYDLKVTRLAYQTWERNLTQGHRGAAARQGEKENYRRKESEIVAFFSQFVPDLGQSCLGNKIS